MKFIVTIALLALLAATPRDPFAGYIVPDAVTHHTLDARGKHLAYTARAGTIIIRDRDEKPQATMFYTAFTLDGANPQTRPITFFYNGGPGSATLWLRMGSFGPVRVESGNAAPTLPPPYQLRPNANTLLDQSDLVFVDMPASGYGRILPGGDPKKVFGSDNDIAAFGQFIQRYLTRFGRWNSPKVLFGESYGTPRTAMLVDYLQNQGVGVNGIVLLSSILNYNLASPETYGGANTDDWQYVFFLPTEAATAWYYHAEQGPRMSLPAYVKEVTAFAMGPYREALLAGSTLPPAQFNAIAQRLHDYTGLPLDYIRDSNLRLSGAKFRAEFRRDRGEDTGAYDSRYRLFTVDRTEEYPSNEPTDASITDAYISLSNAYLHDTLEYHTNLPYLSSAYAAIAQAGGWDFTHLGTLPFNTVPDLQQAMTTNPNLKVFSANGYYDSVTPWLATIYTLNHLSIPPQLRANISYGFYPSGHMVYINSSALTTFRSDLDTWYAKLAH
jgi:carboxypeptidase C (cathepsin A)